ncbi:hypothetical protein ODR79_23610, partial [Escherichia coli]|nr:hypothetical protein [Escherichia coli]
KMPAFEWVHVQLHQQKGMISLSPPTICNSANESHMSKGPERASNQSDTCGCGITVITVLTGHLIEKLTRHYPRLVLPAFLFVLRHIEFVLEFFIKPARSAATAKEFRIQRVDLKSTWACTVINQNRRILRHSDSL